MVNPWLGILGAPVSAEYGRPDALYRFTGNVPAVRLLDSVLAEPAGSVSAPTPLKFRNDGASVAPYPMFAHHWLSHAPAW